MESSSTTDDTIKMTKDVYDGIVSINPGLKLQLQYKVCDFCEKELPLEHESIVCIDQDCKTVFDQCVNCELVRKKHAKDNIIKSIYLCHYHDQEEDETIDDFKVRKNQQLIEVVERLKSNIRKRVVYYGESYSAMSSKCQTMEDINRLQDAYGEANAVSYFSNDKKKKSVTIPLEILPHDLLSQINLKKDDKIVKDGYRLFNAIMARNPSYPQFIINKILKEYMQINTLLIIYWILIYTDGKINLKVNNLGIVVCEIDYNQFNINEAKIFAKLIE